jgi:hypothetical protein
MNKSATAENSSISCVNGEITNPWIATGGVNININFFGSYNEKEIDIFFFKLKNFLSGTEHLTTTTKKTKEAHHAHE